MLKGDSVLINGSGEQKRDFVHVSDVAQASVRALDRGDGEIVNVGSGIGTSVNTIYSTMVAISGYQRTPVHGPAKQGEVFQIFLDASRARNVLGWTPALNLKDGLTSTLQFFPNALTAQLSS